MGAALSPAPEPAIDEYRRLDIGRIDAYDRNPRFLPNPKARELEASLRATGGLDGALAVTRRPGAKNYMVQQGGNTTLALLKKLYDETGDERFRYVRADIRPWTGDLDVMVRHYRENNTRGDLSFSERSLEMLALYKQYCEDRAAAGDKPTTASFCEHLADRFGVACAPSNFSLYRFTAEALAGAMPFLVRRTRFSKSQAVALRRRYTRIRALWRDKGAGTREEFDEVFFGLLERQDQGLEKTFGRDADDDPASLPEITYNDDDLLSGLQNEFTRSEEIDCSFAQAGVWISAALRCEPLLFSESARDHAAVLADTAAIAAGNDVSCGVSDCSPPLSPPGKSREAARHRAAGGAPPAFAHKDDASAHDAAGGDLASLRARALACATRIALRHRLEDIIVALPGAGFGYIVAEVHDDLLTPAAAGPQPSVAAWWALAAGCALSMTPEAFRDRHMPDRSFLRATLDQDNVELLAQGRPLRAFDQSLRVWNAMTAKDWSDYLTLQRLAKDIVAAAGGLASLWTSSAPPSGAPRP